MSSWYAVLWKWMRRGWSKGAVDCICHIIVKVHKWGVASHVDWVTIFLFLPEGAEQTWLLLPMSFFVANGCGPRDSLVDKVYVAYQQVIAVDGNNWECI